MLKYLTVFLKERMAGQSEFQCPSAYNFEAFSPLVADGRYFRQAHSRGSCIVRQNCLQTMRRDKSQDSECQYGWSEISDEDGLRETVVRTGRGEQGSLVEVGIVKF